MASTKLCRFNSVPSSTKAANELTIGKVTLGMHPCTAHNFIFFALAAGFRELITSSLTFTLCMFMFFGPLVTFESILHVIFVKFVGLNLINQMCHFYLCVI